MNVQRRGGAPRLIEWTGERCVPWTPDVQVVYEHYHRYLWAAELVAGRRVLDIGSGEGFGSAILAGRAELVQGIDVDPRTVEHSRLNYAAPNLRFDVGSALELEAFDSGSFDAVVMFEMIEHVSDHEAVIAQVDRLLAPDGLLIVSTPDRRVYSQASGQTNPYHERELSEAEFRALLTSRFAHVALWGQRTVAGSRVGALDPGAGGAARSFFLERSGDEWRPSGEPTAMYLVAVASQAALEPAPPLESHLLDAGLEIMRGHERAATAAREELERARSEAAARQAEAEHHREVIAELKAHHAAEQDSWVGQLARRTGELEAQAADARAEAEATRRELARIDESVTWRLFQRARGRLYGALGGTDSPPARVLQWTLHTAGRLLRAPVSPVHAPPRTLRPIELPAVADPVVSIIIPVHARPDLTEACLRAIAAHTDGPAYEVIVVDDDAGSDHVPVWDALRNANVIHNAEPLGFIRNNNLAAEHARGRHLVLLNNDTEVRPGWLRALVKRAESAPDVGVVVPKLLYPDGSLQEAGGIIFNDGSGWNFGRLQDPALPEFNYVREVDYGSGAALLVRADLWRRLGGFDERYLPMYYEDTDLCFAARDAGYRVLFEPRAEVVHVEGATAGQDLEAGPKRYQEANRPKFVDKWRTRLEAEQYRHASSNVRRASDRNRGPHVLVIDHRVPSPDRDSGSLRMLAILRELRALGCRVTFLPDNHHRIEPYTTELQGLGVEVLYTPLNPNAEIASIGPYLKLAIISRPYVAPRYMHGVREYAPSARILYDTVDLHYLREARRAELEGPAAAGVARAFREIELALIRTADVTSVVTDTERAVIQSEVPEAQVVVLPNANAVSNGVGAADSRKGLLFVGGFEHTPNIDAAKWLVRAIMPHVWRELGEVPVALVGPDPPPDVQSLRGPSVEVLGWVEDLDPLVGAARIAVAPLRYGAGMKGKVTQSLAAGLPVVTTSIGAEGLDAVDGRDLLIADGAEAFAERIVTLYRDEALWSSLSEAGRNLARRVCSPERLRGSLEALLAD